MLRVVCDTVVFVRSLINPHSICGQMIFSYNKAYQLFVSRPIVTEILEVLKRPELISKFHTLKNMDFGKIIDIIGLANVVEIPEILQVSRDPKDNIFIATAFEAVADYLISEDKDLLDVEEYKGVKIINTATFLRILKESKK